MIDQVIDGDYRIERLLGQGAFGEVYLAREINLDRPVAIKVLSQDGMSDKNVQRFLNEAKVLASLNHPNVVQVYRLGEFEGNPYIALEYLTGRTFREIQLESRPPLKDLVSMLTQVCSGLDAIHGLGIVHRDLSANNIMLNDAGTVKILDLGLAKDVSAAPHSTKDQYLTGTVTYIAPEQIEGKTPTPASDVFSFGVVMYELLTGVNPFQAEHPMSVLYNIAHREPVPLEEHAASCPPQLAQLLWSCLEKPPQDRPQSAKEVGARLSEILAHPDVDGHASVEKPAPEKKPPSGPHNPYLNRVMIKDREQFFGRRQEVKRIYSRLNATPPGSVSIVGDRKSGKSSLLNFIYMRHNRQTFLEAPEKMVMVFLDLKREKGITLESFVDVLIRMASLELRGRLEISDCGRDLDGVRDMVQRMDEAGFRLTLLMDQFEAITNNPNFDLEFFSFLRFLANHYDVAYLTSSRRDLQSLCHTQEISDSPFFNIFTMMSISALRRDEAEEMVRVPSEKVGRPLAQYSEQILDMAGLLPAFLQMGCSHAFEYLDDNPDATPDFEEIDQRFYDEAKFHYKYMWDAFDGDDRSVIIRVAKNKSIPDALRHVLGELSRKHYVESGGSGPRLFSSTFENFAKTETPEGAKKSLLGRLFGA